MVKTILAVLVSLNALAYAGDDYEDEDDEPAFNLFGFGMNVGMMPVDGAAALAMSLGLGVEHPVFTKTRVAAEYDWIWLTPRDDSERASKSTLMRPERSATGHRAALLLRRELKGKSKGGMRMFVDGELGGAVVLANDTMRGMTVMPGVFTGLRAGYDLYSNRDDSPSRMVEAAFLLRATVVPNGVGMTFGIGFYWGN